MSDEFDPDEWVESDSGCTYEHRDTGETIHFEAYEGRKHRSNIIESADVTQNDELRELIEEWRETGVMEAYGMNWNMPADELEELIDNE